MQDISTSQAKLQIVIVNYKTSAFVIRCVQSIIRHGVADAAQITIVDNASPDNSVDVLRAALPTVRLVPSNKNGGFGYGVNLGTAAGVGAYVLVLNPDTYFQDNSVAPVIEYLDANPQVGLVGLDLTNPDGSRQYSARRFYSLLDVVARRVRSVGLLMPERIERHLMKSQWSGAAPFDAEWVMGTGFIVRRALFHEIGGMDDSYFLYMEDLDLCARVWHAGKKVRCIPGAHLYHEHQRSSANGFTALMKRAGRSHLKSLVRFSRKFTMPVVSQPGTAAIVRAYAKNGYYQHDVSDGADFLSNLRRGEVRSEDLTNAS